jgi:hypothetical protein
MSRDSLILTFVRLIVEMILKKYKGPLNKFSWCPVVIVKVLSALINQCFGLLRSKFQYWSIAFQNGN